MSEHQSGLMVNSNVIALASSSPFTDDCILRNDGWMSTQTGDLLFWVPAENRASFLSRSIYVMGTNMKQTRINLLRFACGLNWENCRKSSE
jgi:hypothetical protein